MPSITDYFQPSAGGNPLPPSTLVLDKEPSITDFIQPAPSPTHAKVFSRADELGLPRDLVNGIASTESGWSHKDKRGNVIRSPKNALGLMQVVGESGGHYRTIGGKRYDLLDEDQNIEAGLNYLKEGYDYGGGDPKIASLYYFGGKGAAAKLKSSGRVPKISDGGATADQYINATTRNVKRPSPQPSITQFFQPSSLDDLSDAQPSASIPETNINARRREIRTPKPRGQVVAGENGNTVYDARGNVIALNARQGHTPLRGEVAAPVVSEIPTPSTQPSLAGQVVTFPAGRSGNMIRHVLQEGETPETVAETYQVDPATVKPASETSQPAPAPVAKSLAGTTVRQLRRRAQPKPESSIQGVTSFAGLQSRPEKSNRALTTFAGLQSAPETFTLPGVREAQAGEQARNQRTANQGMGDVQAVNREDEQAQRAIRQRLEAERAQNASIQAMGKGSSGVSAPPVTEDQVQEKFSQEKAAQNEQFQLINSLSPDERQYVEQTVKDLKVKGKGTFMKGGAVGVGSALSNTERRLSKLVGGVSGDFGLEREARLRDLAIQLAQDPEDKGFTYGVGQGIGSAGIEVPQLLGTGVALKGATLPVMGALESKTSSEALQNAITGYFYHKGMQFTAPLGRAGNALVWTAFPTAQGVAEGKGLGESLGSGLTLGAMSLTGGENRAQVEENGRTRPATVNDVEAIKRGKVKLVPPTHLIDESEQERAANPIVPKREGFGVPPGDRLEAEGKTPLNRSAVAPLTPEQRSAYQAASNKWLRDEPLSKDEEALMNAENERGRQIEELTPEQAATLDEDDFHSWRFDRQNFKEKPQDVNEASRLRFNRSAVAPEMPAEQVSTPKTIIRHADPRIDGGEIVGRTSDGKLKVQREDGGISTVQNPRTQGNKLAAIQKVGAAENPNVEAGKSEASVPTERAGVAPSEGAKQLEPVPQGYTRFYRADSVDAESPQGKNWARDPEYVSQKYGAGQMNGNESVWYIDVPDKPFIDDAGHVPSIIDNRTLEIHDIKAEPKLFRKQDKRVTKSHRPPLKRMRLSLKIPMTFKPLLHASEMKWRPDLANGPSVS
jgi:hypothetical protein